MSKCSCCGNCTAHCECTQDCFDEGAKFEHGICDQCLSSLTYEEEYDAWIKAGKPLHRMFKEGAIFEHGA